MNPQELTLAIFTRIKKRVLIIVLFAVATAALLAMYAYKSPKSYTSTATIFPLTAGNDNSSNSVLSALMGGGDNGKSFTNENSVNIVELAQSRTTREEVAATKVPSQGNKTIAELLLTAYNANRGIFQKEIKIAPNDPALINWATENFKTTLAASITKNSSFLLNYTGPTPDVVKVVSYAFIDKISAFYIDLKREKARMDFEFASGKVDSLRKVMNVKDRKLIDMDRKTLFTNTMQLQYRVPTENVLADKEMIRAQYANAVANQQNAAYKLQKATPVIKILDKPDAPYNKSGKSPITYGIIGFLIGFILFTLIFISPALLNYGKLEANKMLYGERQAA